MSLRNRLLLGLTGAFVVFMVAASFTVKAQRDQLYDQVDAQLSGTPVPRQAPEGRSEDALNPPGGQPPVQSISELFVARVEDDGQLTMVVEGQLLNDQPDVRQLIDEAPEKRTLRTVTGQEGLSDFRVLYIPGPQPGAPPSVIALPLDNADANARLLLTTFAGVALLMALALGLVGYWVSRFGISPITRMTATAEAIAAGDRSQRADDYGTDTEAGRLANAFNVMLDERDVAEDRLRRFVSDASHELRTPLTSIRGYLDLYAEGGFRQPGQLDDAVRRMRGESARMNLLVEDLLLLAKLDEQQVLQIGSVALGPMLDDVAASALAAKPGRSIHVQADDGLDLTISADPLRLQQAIAAVVDNALTHTPAGTEVRLAATAGQSTVLVSVSDDGPGIAVDDLQRVFDRFHRADTSRSRDSGGSGLGLAVAKAVIEAHDGTITVASTVDQGATFTIELPIHHRNGQSGSAG